MTDSIDFNDQKKQDFLFSGLPVLPVLIFLVFSRNKFNFVFNKRGLGNDQERFYIR